MQCQYKEKDAMLEKDVVSVVESSDFQFGTRHVEDSALLFVSGYISRCLLRSVKCSDCRELLCKRPDTIGGRSHSYIDDISRGGLVEPSSFVFNVASHASQ